MSGGGGVPEDREVRLARTTTGHISRRFGRDSPEFKASKRKLEALNAANRVDALVASWPELSAERLDRIAGLLRAGARGGSEAEK